MVGAFAKSHYLWRWKFTVFDCMYNLLVAHLGMQGIRTDHKEKGIRLFNTAMDFLLTICGGEDVFPIFPGVKFPGGQ